MPDPIRPHDVSRLTAGELERARRELAASLALARPDSPAAARPVRARKDINPPLLLLGRDLE